MKARNMEFTAPEFAEFALVGEEMKDGERLLADKLARDAAAADLAKRQQLFALDDAQLFSGICDGCGEHSTRLHPVDCAPIAGGAICERCLQDTADARKP